MSVLWADQTLTKTGIKTIQINLGNRCNQRCTHCHIGASPHGTNNMDGRTAAKVLHKLLDTDVHTIEFTGGAPELNPNLTLFLQELARNSRQCVVRTNLTVLDMPEYTHFVDLYKRLGTKVVASLPSCFRDATDTQRGKGVFDASISVLRRLNRAGFGTGSLPLELVYNPSGSHLPPSEAELERDYREVLGTAYGIRFDRLVAMANVPVGGFKKRLLEEGGLDDYMSLLVNNYNPETLDRIMCRRLVAIDYQGYVYDCDFNLALGMKTRGYEQQRFWEIDFERFDPEITCGAHCYACTVNRGSSCHGALTKDGVEFDARGTVQRYYGVELKRTGDLKTGACCPSDTLPSHVRKVLPYIADEIRERYYGCGSPVPLVLDNLRVLDIGCGTGRDCYVLSKLVGEGGFVYGIDMTENQIAVAKKYVADQTARFGYKAPNVRFIQDYVEKAADYFADGSLDLVISNCVVNLVEDKESLLRQVWRLLRDGGEFFFSDIYADRRVPPELRENPVLYGECLGGALYWKDFERIARMAGFNDPRVVSKRVLRIDNDEIKALVGTITFYSITYRLWKLEGLEDGCEDYGHVAVYRGGIAESPFSYSLDADHVFERDKPERVCGNTALMLAQTRLGSYFEVSGSFDRHFGPFEGFGAPAAKQKEEEGAGGCSCC